MPILRECSKDRTAYCGINATQKVIKQQAKYAQRRLKRSTALSTSSTAPYTAWILCSYVTFPRQQQLLYFLYFIVQCQIHVLNPHSDFTVVSESQVRLKGHRRSVETAWVAKVVDIDPLVSMRLSKVSTEAYGSNGSR
ncbi:hypothetical protein T12_680 [Trichinella patagoniensis]|uniref:Uncharacterized protein n=1 Tax=Trichinella patagoniensis TaxID=990121 RepID=A0A0V0Z752_9BILA|nr:hypothetical protein T12_680 [Trichinella patagoniensis]